MSGGSRADPYYQRNPPKKSAAPSASEKGAKKRGRKPNFEEVKRLYFDEGLSIPAVAEALDVSRYSVVEVFKEHGLQARRRQYTDQDVKDLYDKGLTQQQVADHFKISFQSVIEIFKRNGWKARPLLKTPIDRTLELYRQGYTQKEMAEILGVSPAAVWQLLNKMGLVSARNKDWKMREASNRAIEYEKGREWRRKRKEIHERDNHTCQGCGRSPDKVNGVRLAVHHIVPLAQWIYEGRDPSEYPDDLLVTVCKKCHSIADAGRGRMKYVRPPLK
ncbi:MAG: HNH endonuclease [Candidatus Thorarchaeota archaeon]|nr:HNH endonuclease [Candidatus Thorarchaeota archaeon]